MPSSLPTLIQARILRYLRKAEEEGRTPSYREMAAAFDWTAVSTVRDHVAALKAKGLVTLTPQQARSLRLTELGRLEAVSVPSKRAHLGETSQPVTFSTAVQEIMDLLAPWLQPRSYAKGSILWREGDPANRLLIVDAGRLRAFRQLADGRTATVLQFSPGEVLGFAPFFDGGGYPATIEAVEATKVRYVVRKDLLRAMREPRVAMALLGFLAQRLRKAFDAIEQISLRGAMPRVAAALRFHLKGTDFQILTLPGSAASFAETLGLAPATLSRTLAQLVTLGVLHHLGPRRYQVLLPEELVRLAAGEEGESALR
jgi:CRP/FNR family transcriptional regulator, cyclic AMP receptor protein